MKLLPSHRVVEVDGVRLVAHRPSQVQEELRRWIQELPRAREDVRLRFEGPGGMVVAIQRLKAIGVEEILFFFVIYALVAWVVLWFGGLVFALGGRPTAGRAYLAWAVLSFTFLLTFYDYHTRAWLAPLFSVSTVGIPVSTLWLAYGFPEPPLRYRDRVRRTLILVTILATAAALWLVLGFITGVDPSIVRRIVDVTIGPCIATLGLASIVRMKRSTGRSRAELLTAIWGLALTPLLISLINLLRLATGVDFLHLVLPFAVLLFPLSIGYALIRTNILATSAVLSPGVMTVPLSLSALLLAVLGAYAVHWALKREGGAVFVPMIFGAWCFAALLAFSQRAAARLFFPAAHQFRPAIERLSDHLTSMRERADVLQALHGVVAQWLPTLWASILAPDSLSSVAHLPPDGAERLSDGKRVWTLEAPWKRSLLIPMMSLGELRGVLCVGPKRGAALYTEEDLDLLETIASLGALALHHARTIEELERLQLLEVDILRGEKQQALGALSAEICHEVVYPLNFIRDLLKQAARSGPISPEDIEMGREEIGRLERMISSLRTLDPPAPRLAPVLAAVPIERAVHLVRDLVRQKRLSVSVEIPPDLTFIAHTDLAVQLFVNLLRNAAQAAEEGGAIGVRTFERPGNRFIEVWDTGKGIPGPVSEALFTRRITTKEGGQGIGLTVAHRIARNFRWTLSFEREADRTCFRVMVPSSLPSLPREDQ